MKRALVGIGLLLATAASPAFAQNWFDSGVLSTDAGVGEAYGVGGFEGDGDVDVWFVDGNPGAWTAFRVFFNDGLGGFTSGPATAVPVANGYLPLRANLRSASPRAAAHSTGPASRATSSSATRRRDDDGAFVSELGKSRASTSRASRRTAAGECRTHATS